MRHVHANTTLTTAAECNRARVRAGDMRRTQPGGFLNRRTPEADGKG
jgi:hypothetical protein